MSKFSVKKPLTVFVAVVIVLVLGIVSYFKMTPDLLPNMDFPYVLIMTTYPGANPEKVEAEVTKPLEQSMATLENIKTVASSSAENYSMVMLEFYEGVDLNTIGVDIQQNISALQGMWDDMVGAPFVLKINPSMLPVMAVAVSREGMDNTQLTDFLDQELMLKLEGISGVARITTSGAVRREIHVVLDQAKFDALQMKIATTLAAMSSGMTDPSSSAHLIPLDLSQVLTMDTVSQLLTAQNFSMPAGTVMQDGISYMVSVGDEMTTLEQIENLQVADLGIPGIPPILLKDVAGVMITDNRASTYAKLDGTDSVMLSFEKQSTYATAEASSNILARFDELEEEYEGLRFVPLMDQGDYIYMVVEQILSSLLFGALFAILILYVFLRDLRPTFITLCSIPISVVFAIVLMYFSGVTINMMSLSGLAVAVGMLVDNSVVVIENIYRLRAKGATAVQAAVSGAKQVAGAVTASTLTTVCVFLPIVFVTGITKQLFVDLALTMTFSLLASLIVSLTLVPAMASGMLRKEKVRKEKLMGRFLSGYGKALSWSLCHKAVVLLTAVALLIGTTLWCFSRGFTFMPETDTPNVNVTVQMPEDATMEEASQLADEVLSRIDTLDGIETVGAMMASQEEGGLSIATLMSGGQGGAHDVTIYIILEDENGSGKAMGKKIEALCADMACTVTATSEMMDTSMLIGDGIDLQIYADDIDTLQAAAAQAAEALSKIPGVKEIDNGNQEATPALHVSIDPNRAMASGLTVAQIYMQLAEALQNTTAATTLQLDGTNTSVVVEKLAASQLTAEKLQSYMLTVTAPSGDTFQIPLSQVATVEQTSSLSAIARQEQRRYISVKATLEEGANITHVSSEAEKVMKNLELPEGATYAFKGENEMIMDAMEQLMLMLVLGVVLVYLVMVAQFQSLKSPFIVMFTIPLAFTGGFAAILICGMEISVISLIGFIMLTGIIVNNGIVLVDYINQLRLDGVARREAIVEAGKTRMRPILMTTVTTILGMLVVALSRDVGNTLMRPVSVVCIGGLTYATIMTLFVVPCIYDALNKKELRKVSEEDLKDVDL